MVKTRTTTPIPVISFFLLAACGALCQSEHSPVDFVQGVQFDGSGRSSEVQSQGMHKWGSLPDAPLIQPPTPGEKLQSSVNGTHSLLTLVPAGINAGAMRNSGPGQAAPEVQFTLAGSHQAGFTEEKSFLDKYLYTALLQPGQHYSGSTSDGYVGRAAYAAARVFITRDDSGKNRVNTSSLVRALISMGADAASRSYGRRSLGESFSDFGSTIGNDAGMDLLHEFEPGIRQMLTGHTPKFVSRIGERIANHEARREVVSARAR
jgi:hypothetical protein